MAISCFVALLCFVAAADSFTPKMLVSARMGARSMISRRGGRLFGTTVKWFGDVSERESPERERERARLGLRHNMAPDVSAVALYVGNSYEWRLDPRSRSFNSSHNTHSR